MLSLSLVIPMYNEEDYIEYTLNTILSYFKKNKVDYEIVVVDDGSIDMSVKKVEPFINDKLRLVRCWKNGGKGKAVKVGVLKAEKDFVGFMDADLPYALDGVLNLFKGLEKFHIAIGTRSMPGAVVDVRPLWYRRVLGHSFSMLREFIVSTGIKDTQCGAKCFRKDVARLLFTKQKLSGFGFDAELLFLAKKYKFSVLQLPLHLLKKHSFKDSKLNPLVDPFKMFFDLLRIRFYNLIGVY